MHKLIKQAFTLIELLVVIAIIGILSGLIIVGMSGMTQKATIAKAQVFSNSLRNSLMMNIMGEWKFDGATSERPAVNADVVDSWGGVNNGTIPASPSIPTIKTASNCVSGSCLSFDGVDDYVDCGNKTNLKMDTNDFTIEAWTKTSMVGFRTIFSTRWWDVGYSVSIAAGKPYIRLYGGGLDIASSGDVTKTINDNQWHHLVYRVERGADVGFYIDGNYAGHVSLSVIGTLTNNRMNKIGANQTNLGAFENLFDGSIDDVRIYNAAMPTSQIKEQYYAGLNKLLANGGITKQDYQNRIGELAISL